MRKKKSEERKLMVLGERVLQIHYISRREKLVMNDDLIETNQTFSLFFARVIFYPSPIIFLRSDLLSRSLARSLP